jgi:hypothetical protein
MEIEARSLKCILTEDEKQKISKNLARDTMALHNLELEKKSVMSSYKDKADKAQLAVNISARLINDGYDFREVDCEVVRDYGQKVVYYVRTDTGETVETREMTRSELQLRLQDAPRNAEEEEQGAAA